jgi:hypothetical protein
MKNTRILIKATILVICISLAVSCAITKPKLAEFAEEEGPAELQSVRVVSGPSGETVIEITSSRPVPYAAFKLVQPLRIVVGITAVPSEGLTAPVVDGKIIKDIRFEATEKEPVSTRIIATTLSQDVEYTVQDQEGTIRLALYPKEPLEERPAPMLAKKPPAVVNAVEKPPELQSIGVVSTDAETAIKITTSRPVPYGVSELPDPLRIFVELEAIPSEELVIPTVADKRIIKDLRLEATKEPITTTRITVTLAREVGCSLIGKGEAMTITLYPKEPIKEEPSPALAKGRPKKKKTKPRKKAVAGPQPRRVPDSLAGIKPKMTIEEILNYLDRADEEGRDAR